MKSKLAHNLKWNTLNVKIGRTELVFSKLASPGNFWLTNGIFSINNEGNILGLPITQVVNANITIPNHSQCQKRDWEPKETHQMRIDRFSTKNMGV